MNLIATFIAVESRITNIKSVNNFVWISSHMNIRIFFSPVSFFSFFIYFIYFFKNLNLNEIILN